ncbi:30S ribosomal protein S16 [Patescibacteria group bacterium]
MLKIRLQRVGRKHDPSFRVVLTDSKNGPKSNKNIELLGSYDPRRDVREVKGDRVKYWISKGAQVSNTVHNILVGEKIIKGKKVNVLPKKSPVVNEKTEEEKKEEVVDEKSSEETPKEEEKVEETPVEEVKKETSEDEEKSE